MKALEDKNIDRLLFPHYLDLLFLMSDPSISAPQLSDIYIAKEVDKSFQIGMVLSHVDAKLIQKIDFYTCLEIMTSRVSAKVEWSDTLQITVHHHYISPHPLRTILIF